MAITGSYDFDGILIPAAYGKFPSFNVRQKVDTQAQLYLYSSAEYAQMDGAAFRIVIVTFVYDPEAPESLNAQAYNAAKQLPQFANWTDC